MASAQPIKIDTYTPFPKQQEFHACAAKYRLFGGAAGPGKSRGLLEEGCLQAIETPGATTLLLRRTFPELEASMLQDFWRHILPKWRDVPGFSFNESKHTARWPNGSATRFGYCQRESDVYQYQGGEFLFIGIDELTLFTLRQWQFLTSRNRCPVAGSFPCMAGATNPGNIGHAWVKALWIDKKPAPGMERAEEYDPSEYEFIAAKVTDNPIYSADEAYLKTLRSLPIHLRKAFLEGDWEVFAGQYFDCFDYQRMTADERSFDLKKWNPRWVSMDWGYEHPSVIYWHAMCDDNKTRTYREKSVRHMAPRDIAKLVIKESNGEKITDFYLSPDAFAKRTDDLSIADQIGDVLAEIDMVRPSPADNDRIGGWMLMYQMLDAGEWIIGRGCTELLEVLPLLVRDMPDDPEDIVKVDGDDPADAARYGLKSRHRPTQKPLDIRVKERVEAHADKIHTTVEKLTPQTVATLSRRAALLERSRRPAPRFRPGRHN